MASPELVIRALTGALMISRSVWPGCLQVGVETGKSGAGRAGCAVRQTALCGYRSTFVVALCPLLSSVPQHPKEEG